MNEGVVLFSSFFCLFLRLGKVGHTTGGVYESYVP